MSAWHLIDEIDLVRLVCDHAALDRVCDRLEDHADRLPALPSARDVDALVFDLTVSLERHVACEDHLFARLFASTRRHPLHGVLVGHIAARHTACLVQAGDIVAALGPDAQDARAPCAETLGYMLRCFFQGCRQAMAFEEMAILALGADRLTPAARLLLTDRIAVSCG